MNAPAVLPYRQPDSLTRRGRSGLPRRLFSTDEVETLIEADVLDDMKRLELLDGELVSKVGTGPRHWRWQNELMRILARGLPDDLMPGSDATVRLDAFNMPDADVAIVPRAAMEGRLRAEDMLLLIEISDSSLRKDLGFKAKLYARTGVRHYWVLDAKKRRAHVHSEPGPEGYGRVEMVEADGALTLPFEPALVIPLTDLG